MRNVVPRNLLPSISGWSVISRVIASRLIPNALRWRLLRLTGMDIAGCTIEPGSRFLGRNVSIGSCSFINDSGWFDNSATITIGSNVAIGREVAIITRTHAIGRAAFRASVLIDAPVSIGNGAWLGARVTILPGVTIGSGCVVAAGAVVVKDCEPDGLYAGVPARRVRDLQASPVPSGLHPSEKSGARQAV